MQHRVTTARIRLLGTNYFRYAYVMDSTKPPSTLTMETQTFLIFFELNDKSHPASVNICAPIQTLLNAFIR